MAKAKHAITKRSHMSQPAEGYYVDCRCGRNGPLKRTAALALEDYRKHVEAEEADAAAVAAGATPDCDCDGCLAIHESVSKR